LRNDARLGHAVTRHAMYRCEFLKQLIANRTGDHLAFPLYRQTIENQAKI